MAADVESTIRKVLEVHGQLGGAATSIGTEDDLYQRGLSSHASVNVMLALEDAYDLEFPDALLKRDTFRSITSIRGALVTMGVDDA